MISSAIFSIGKGIIGSAAEEKDRKPVQWEQGSAYYLPCIKGLACGWVHRQQRDSEGKSVEDGDQIQSVEAGDRVDTDVTLYIFKAPPEAIHDVLSEDAPAWVKCMTEQFHQLIGSNETKFDGNNASANQLENTSTDGDVPEGILLPVEDSIKISGIVEQIVGSNAKSPGHST
ncbi:hypothetical protein HJC23_001856 [Cyclotella cryptica]|uniref:Uncharacterized protein n=1 Tax=Cyclotella cryptica TaxID=29204 RepID=A0ABD3PZD3_9STRA